jgi:hypothetical protein
MGERRGVYRALVGKPEGRRPLGRPRRRWEDNIKIDLREVGWGVWTGSIWLRIGTGGSSCKCGYEPSDSINAGNFLSSSGGFSFSGRTLLHGVSILAELGASLDIYTFRFFFEIRIFPKLPGISFSLCHVTLFSFFACVSKYFTCKRYCYKSKRFCVARN